ncbi:MAG: hypothetical protein JAY99_03680 [Candidatus Thiodiazotropha lotti]|uniref:Uncharacterized protein n=1 Tax=Candidatus Thiodiazotropha endoloripes TaxID=1818881 RepID=A0A1E2UL09_9GAMM|nr:hypothetical protein [Candidatus Thiodiazotropha endoloripes]MCG7899411.1 hypothetical protein [Candidatus Thiodiazotropha weberae]MCG7992099.1 hypothetical protein [Candidatus Thiodiazotropha lotti]MCG7903985.1 hypothetical protein [Candidatus Thiodiazotropha weberae]MCG7915507.1 hypothetical protein [Candidatus Thiodiazotropha weberae]MCG7998603.1 hypothetical protein [Candidatus Thiodiazotropha lotti]
MKKDLTFAFVKVVGLIIPSEEPIIIQRRAACVDNDKAAITGISFELNGLTQQSLLVTIF